MSITDGASPDPLAEVEHGAALCVLASGSSANCSVVLLRDGDVRRAVLIDLGLSPRRTFRLLAERGIGPHQVDHAIVTHFDSDHFHPGWRTGLPRHTTLRIHERHLPETRPLAPLA